jgi:cytochrome c556
MTNRTPERGEGMMSRGVAIGWVIVELFLVFNIAGAAARGPAEPSADGRQRIVLSRVQRDQVLAEMRRMLESVNGVLRGYVANDLPTIASAARASGMAMAADPELKKKVPAAFLRLGMQTHKGFEDLPDQATAGGTREEALAALAAISNNCVACHTIYRFDAPR